VTQVRPLNVAVVGAGPAGIHTCDSLLNNQKEVPVSVDLYERLPVPFGLVRYGVAPDHPNIQGIFQSLHDLVHDSEIRLVAGVEVGVDVLVEDLQRAYDAVVFATGANHDAPLDIPGVDLPGSFGAAQFVSWYDAHPDFPSDWSLEASQVAVIGAGNVALDISRMLSRRADELGTTEIPEHVHEVFAASQVTDVHIFARRGPAESQFSPEELKHLDDLSDVDVVVDPDDMVIERSSEMLMSSFPQRKQVVAMLDEWSQRDRSAFTAPRRVHLHFMRAPASIEGTSAVEGLTVERTRHMVNGMVEGTGEFETFPVGQVYRAIGYASSPIPGVPFDENLRRVPHQRGRVVDEAGETVPGLYVSGWIKRGPVGLIGSTRMDSRETVHHLLEDAEDVDTSRPGGYDPIEEAFTDRTPAPGIDWEGWLRVDKHERSTGEAQGKVRVKVYERQQLVDIARTALTSVE